jgi:erythromycin esterase
MAIVSSILILGALASNTDTKPAEAFRAWAKSTAIRVNPDAPEVAAIEALVGPARVVALGEPTHGAPELLAFRNRLFRVLVERLGFTAIALETGFTEAHAINRFVLGGPGDAATVARIHLSWGFGEFAGNHELLQWMRDYNANPSSGRKIRFYGIDLTGAKHGAFPDALRAIDFALEYLASVDPAAANEYRKRLNPFLSRFSSYEYLSLSQSERSAFREGLASLEKAVRLRKLAHEAGTDQQAHEWARHSIVVARQLMRMFDVSPPPGPGLSPHAWRTVQARDAAMAENLRWVLSQERSGGRVLVFAHNAHVISSTLQGGVWSVFRQPPAAMGKALRGTLRGDLVVIGTSLGVGAPASENGLGSERRNSYTVDRALASLGERSFILDIRRASSTGPVNNWLSRSQSLRANESTFMTVVPATAFDALYMLDHPPAAR